ncbi:MAG: hypothetical protein IH947_14570 [Bacteroidetes bacterium]|nr:hypothetical protein [Bacteroidota bacterium]MCH8233484.1 hypothetical protein [Bacteroidota bacterium]
MQKFRKFEIFFIVFVLLNAITGCGADIEIEDFSREIWKSDRNGCDGRRAGEIEALLGAKNILLGKSEHEILSLLGRPDKNELYRRSQKFFIYYIDPAPACTGNLHEESKTKYLSIRINAIGNISEIYLYK